MKFIMIKGNEPAMPIQYEEEYGDFGKKYLKIFEGVTIREYFAVMAMQGILANSEFLANYQNIDIHAAAVKNADALIAELNKEPE